jgi:hypothetical protein
MVVLVSQIITVVAVFIFTLPHFIAPKYRSTGVIYPYNISTFSGENPTEQMLEFLGSVDLKNQVIKDLGLVKHYHIDTTGKYWYANLIEAYNGNVNTDATLYQAVEINAEDVNPDTAYLIAKDVLKRINQTILDVQVEKSVEAEHLLKKGMEAKKQEIDSLAAISRTMSVQYGLVDDVNQNKEVFKSYYQMLASGKNGKAFEEVSAQVKNMEEKGEMFKEVNQHLKAEITEYDNIDIKYRQVVDDVNKQLTFTNIVSKPFVPDKKVFPVRWLIALFACGSVFMFTVLSLIIMEKMKSKAA